MTQPLIHHHVGSKEGLWRAAMAELFSGVRIFTAPREGASPNARLTHLVDRYLREPFRGIVAAVRAGQRAGLIAPHVRW